MLYMCAYTWHPGTTAEKVNQMIAKEASDKDHGVTVRGYYPLVGGGAGYLLMEADDPQRISDYLTPTMGLLAWDVRQVMEKNWDQTLAEAVSQAKKQAQTYLTAKLSTESRFWSRSLAFELRQSVELSISLL